MSDLVSRQTVLKGISLSCTGRSDVIKAEAALVRYVKMIPSAEPEKRTQERTETHACDLISRQAAIKAIRKDLHADKDFMSAIICEGIENVLNNLPSEESEIIRCKDCLIHGVCRFEQGLGLDGYCSQAERRTDG